MREDATIAERMARREARALLLVPPSIPAPPGVLDPRVSLRAITCPRCGAQPGPQDEPPDDRPVVTVLACETLANRALLPALTAAGPGRYLSRGVFAATHRSYEGVTELLAALDTAESWADPGKSTRGDHGLVLPASTRTVNGPDSHFLSPHAGPELDDLNTLYTRVRFAAVLARL